MPPPGEAARHVGPDAHRASRRALLRDRDRSPVAAARTRTSDCYGTTGEDQDRDNDVAPWMDEMPVKVVKRCRFGLRWQIEGYGRDGAQYCDRQSSYRALYKP